LESEARLAFSAVFTPPHNRSRLVGLFLAVLELIKSRQIAAEQPEVFGEIWLYRIAEPAQPEQPTVTPIPT
jgi:segregation and condensation protein A